MWYTTVHSIIIRKTAQWLSVMIWKNVKQLVSKFAFATLTGMLFFLFSIIFYRNICIHFAYFFCKCVKKAMNMQINKLNHTIIKAKKKKKTGSTQWILRGCVNKMSNSNASWICIALGFHCNFNKSFAYAHDSTSERNSNLINLLNGWICEINFWNFHQHR